MADDQRRAAHGRGGNPLERQPAADTRAAPSRHQNRRDDEPFDVRVEFVVLDGEAGKELARRQAAVIRKVLQRIHDNPPQVTEYANGADGTA